MTHASGCAGTSGEILIMRLQVVTLIWMVVECALALFSAWRARSPVLLAFGADSLIESLGMNRIRNAVDGGSARLHCPKGLPGVSSRPRSASG